MNIILVILIIILLLLTSFKDLKTFRRLFLYTIRRINLSYLDLFKERSLMVKYTQVTLVFLSEIFNLIVIYSLSLKFVEKHFSLLGTTVGKGAITIFSFIVVHYLMGYILLLSSNIHKYMGLALDKSIKSDFILTYFILSSFVLVLVLAPNELGGYVVPGAVGITVSYFLNVKILLKFMSNPSCIKLESSDKVTFPKVFVAASTMVFMIIITLFLGVCLTTVVDPLAFTNEATYFDLFYYTMATITTIGFGDISPASPLAKVMAIVISFTSIICLTMFFGSIFSIKDKN